MACSSTRLLLPEPRTGTWPLGGSPPIEEETQLRLHADVASQLRLLRFDRLGPDADGIELAFSLDAPVGFVSAAGYGGAASHALRELGTTAFAAAVTALMLLLFAASRSASVSLQVLGTCAAAAMVIALQPPKALLSTLGLAESAPAVEVADSSPEGSSSSSCIPPAPASPQTRAAVAVATLEIRDEEEVTSTFRAIQAWAQTEPREAHLKTLACRSGSWLLLETRLTPLVTAPLEVFILAPGSRGSSEALTVQAFVVFAEAKPVEEGTAAAAAALRRLLGRAPKSTAD